MKVSGCANYCCLCEEETPHVEVPNDEVFEFGLQCMKCGTVWEAYKEEEEKEDDSN